jgi:hypothetical protein
MGNTPFDRAKKSADSFALCLVSSAAIWTLVERDLECASAHEVLDWQNDELERDVLREALQERKAIDELFIEAGNWLESLGISA